VRRRVNDQARNIVAALRHILRKSPAGVGRDLDVEYDGVYDGIQYDVKVKLQFDDQGSHIQTWPVRIYASYSQRGGQHTERNVSSLHDIVQLIVGLPGVSGVDLYLAEDCTICDNKEAIALKLAVRSDTEALFRQVFKFYNDEDRQQLLGGLVESMLKGLSVMEVKARAMELHRPLIVIIEMPEGPQGDTLSIVSKKFQQPNIP